MDGARIQALSYRGFGIAAQKVGLVYAVHRPAGANDPIGLATKLADVSAAFAPHSKYFQFGAPPRHGEVLFNGLFEPTNYAVGDYFVSANETYFILSLEHLQPPLCARATKIMRFMRPYGASQPGINGYGGNTATTETEYMRGWPVSVEMMKPGASLANLPGDAGAAGFEFLVPNAGEEIRSADICIDAENNRYVINSCELTPLGWRLRVKQAVT